MNMNDCLPRHYLVNVPKPTAERQLSRTPYDWLKLYIIYWQKERDPTSVDY